MLRGKYVPARGGHAPGHLREAFCAAVDAYAAWEADDPIPEVEVGYNEVPMRIDDVFGLMWNCTDVMPGILGQQIGDLARLGHPAWGSYGQGARLMRALIAQAATKIAA
jgi:hypothetical protein